MRRVTRGDLVAGRVDGHAMRLGLDNLGMEVATGCPAYDNGDYFVVDTVKGLEWTVMASTGQQMKTFPLDKYEAIKWADELQEADRRAQ